MSYGWSDFSKEEERKDYGVQGTVTISTQEYRDLLDRINELKIAGQREHDDWSKAVDDRNKAQNDYRKAAEELEKAQKEVDLFKSWLAKDDSLALQFFKYKESLEGEDDEAD